MNIKCMQLVSMMSLASLVACEGVDGPEGEDDVGEEVAGETGEDLGTAKDNICSFNNNAPDNDVDEVASLASSAYVVMDGEADGNCDQYVTWTLGNSSARIKTLDINVDLQTLQCGQNRHIAVWGYDASSLSWVSIPVTTVVHQPGVGNFTCYLTVHKNFSSGNDYNAISTEVWVDGLTPTVTVEAVRW